MAIILSNQENMDLLLLLVKLAIALSLIAMALIILFWLRLKKLEKRMHLSKKQGRKQVKSRFVSRIPKERQRSLVTNQGLSNRPPSNYAPRTQVYRQTANPITLKKSPKRSASWLWVLAIAIASITGIAIAIMQLGNSFISPEFMPFIWLFIGVSLFMSATFVEIV